MLEAKGGLGIFIFQNFHCESVSGPREIQTGAVAAAADVFSPPLY